MKVPTQVWVFSRFFFLARLTFVGFLVLSGHPQAGLELGYKPALVADFPVSLLYLIAPKAGPYVAAIVGPIWWFFLPIVGWWLIWGRSNRPNRDAI
jgi:hypothetical protein